MPKSNTRADQTETTPKPGSAKSRKNVKVSTRLVAGLDLTPATLG
jgi:hypothetical protein